MLTTKMKYNNHEHDELGGSMAEMPEQPFDGGYKLSHKKMRYLSLPYAAAAQRQHHVKQLITTAAAGTGIVGDVDAMLTPMHNHRGHSISPKQPRDSRPERNLWSKTEMLEMLQIMDDNNAVEKLNDKSIKSDTVFRLVEEIMHDNGYRKKSHVQIWTKWKFLKSTYNTTKRSGTVPKMIPIEVYQKLCKMLDSCGSGNVSVSSSAGGIAGGNGGASGGGGSGGGDGEGDGSVGPNVSDCENSMLSMEGEKSNGVNEKSSSVLSTAGVQNDSVYEQENDLDMAHPIFGFRLGLVKPEPADTGYETNVDNSETIGDQEPLSNSQNSNATGVNFEHTPFEVEVKQELLEGNANTPPPTAPASPMPIPAQLPARSRTNPESVVSNRLSRVPVGSAQLITSTPQREPTTQHEQQLPPLRVAPFAKEQINNGSAVSGVLKIDRPPPPLSMKPSRLNHTSDITFTQHTSKLMLPKLPAQSQAQLSYNYVRLPKEISVQPARNSSLLRLKSVPMRKTPYSLRPERMIPDLEQSISPPPSPVPEATATLQSEMHAQSYQRHQQPYSMYDTSVATTSRQAQISLLKDRKRRLPFDMKPVPMKLPHQSHMSSYMHDSSSFAQLKDDLSDDNDSEYEDNDDDDLNGKYNGASYLRKEKSNKPKLDAIFEKELFKLADGLRQTQRDMLHDFFEQQKEFARREHEFQLKQDMIVIRAFRKQTEELVKTAKIMLGVDSKYTLMNDKSSLNCAEKPESSGSFRNISESKERKELIGTSTTFKLDQNINHQIGASLNYLCDYIPVAGVASLADVEQAPPESGDQAENTEEEDNAENEKDDVGTNTTDSCITTTKPESI